jgi:hypothetical protein
MPLIITADKVLEGTTMEISKIIMDSKELDSKTTLEIVSTEEMATRIISGKEMDIQIIITMAIIMEMDSPVGIEMQEMTVEISTAGEMETTTLGEVGIIISKEMEIAEIFVMTSPSQKIPPKPKLKQKRMLNAGML